MILFQASQESLWGTYAIRAPTHLLAPQALLQSTGAPPNQAVSLQRFVVLDMLCELAERVAGGRTLCATEERHDYEARRNTRSATMVCEECPGQRREMSVIQGRARRGGEGECDGAWMRAALSEWGKSNRAPRSS